MRRLDPVACIYALGVLVFCLIFWVGFWQIAEWVIS